LRCEVLVYRASRPAGSLVQVAVVPWVCVQLTTIPWCRGVRRRRGLVGRRGSDQWWPLTRHGPLTARTRGDPGSYDLTGPAWWMPPPSRAGERPTVSTDPCCWAGWPSVRRGRPLGNEEPRDAAADGRGLAGDRRGLSAALYSAARSSSTVSSARSCDRWCADAGFAHRLRRGHLQAGDLVVELGARRCMISRSPMGCRACFWVGHRTAAGVRLRGWPPSR